jgi:hypothetical protein
MQNVDDQIMAAVASALAENPSATVDELFAIAVRVSPSIGELSRRQFHARYPLQIKRKMNPGRRRGPRRAKSAGRGGIRAREAIVMREAVRSTLLGFAADLTAAEERKDLVRVVAGVDEYVDQVMKATGR